jgi:peptide/nickel transport system ATP-binding protein
VLDNVTLPLQIAGIRGAERKRRGMAALEQLELADKARNKATDLSGGQKQRVVMARAIVMGPSVLVADEPISMLDMSVRAKILQLMLDLKQQLDLSYVYITHDLASAKFFCDRIAIMYLGRIVEIGDTDEIFAHPRHPYTKALLKAIPNPDPSVPVARDLPRGEIPDAARPPLGCAFHPRCPLATPTCGWESRDLRTVLEEHWLRQGGEAYAEESRVLGNLDVLDEPATSAVLGKADPAAAMQILTRIRSENPDEPMWKGVASMDQTEGGVALTFHGGEDPALRRAGGVEVACVLYGDGRDG